MYPTRISSVYLTLVTFRDARILLRKQAISKPTAAASLTVNILYILSLSLNDMHIRNLNVPKWKLSELKLLNC